MYIIPFFIEEPKETTVGFKFWTCWVFMGQNGKAIWETDKSIVPPKDVIDMYLHPNDIHGTHMPTSRKDVFLYKVDKTKTNISDFYTWSDMLSGVECGSEIWRPFFWVGNDSYGEADEWGWEEEMKDIRVGSFGTVDSLWKVLRLSTINI